MGIGDFIPDPIEHAVEKGTEWVGDRVEDVGDWTADRLEDVGWDSGADWVREQSRSVANRMGAEVDEMDLGQTEDKTKLIYGSPGKIRTTAGHLYTFQKAFDDVGNGLKGLDSSHLKGEAADAFRKSVHIQPPKWFTGADAFEDAAGALESFADTVSWAQGKAQQAIDKWKEGTKASEDAADAHKKKVDDYNKAVDHYNSQPADKRDPSSLPPKPGKFTDPGKKLMQDAQDILSDARKQRNTAAEDASSKVKKARDKAPKTPSYKDQLVSGLEEVPLMADHFSGGLIKGVAGITDFVRGINPVDPYNLTHPAEYVTQLNSLAAGLVTVANDPWGAGKQMVTDFMKDPSEGLGRLVPDIALTIATDGAGAGAKAARTADELADAAAGARRAKPHDARPPEGELGNAGRKGSHTPCKGEPVDVVTGAMLMQQTDFALPAAGLALVFERTHLSSYRSGVTFGPTWMCLLDECVQIDAEGVVFAGADGMRLVYPVPRPGTPQLPVTGERRTLEWDGRPDGVMTVTDPTTGVVRTFAAAVPTPTSTPGAFRLDLESVLDRSGNGILVDRDAAGLPTALRHTGGYHVSVDTEGGRVTALRLLDPAASGADAYGGAARARGTVLVRYGYDTRGRLTEVVNSSDKPLVFGYDEQDRVTSWTDRNGTSFHYFYDERGRVVRTEGTDGFLSGTFTYDEEHRVTTYTDSLGHTSVSRYDGRGQVVEETDELGGTTYTEWDEWGVRPLRVTDPLGHTTVYGYDAWTNLTSVLLPDGSSAHARLGALGLPVEVTEPGGAVWRHTYDDRGNLLSTVDPLGAETRYTYNASGHLTAVTDALGGTRHTTPDPAGLPLTLTDELGHTTTVERDAFGRATAITDPLGRRTTMGWTPEGRAAWRAYPDGSRETWTWDAEGNLLAHTDPAGQATRYTYAAFDVPATRTDPDGGTHTFAHDTELRLTGITNPQGLTWSYDYDPAGRPGRERDFNSRVLHSTHDAAGRVVSRTNGAGQTQHYTRDPLGRITRQRAEDGATTEYTYDAAGRMARAVNAGGEVVLEHDPLGRVLRESVNGNTTSYTYDALGRCTSRTTPSGLTSTWTYDGAGRPEALLCGAGSLAFVHDASGQETERRLAAGLTLTQTWDSGGRLAVQSLTAAGGAAPTAGQRLIQYRSYVHRPDDQITEIRDLTSGTRRLTLDPLGRPTGVNAHTWQESYTYDGSGNITHAATPGHPAPGERSFDGTLLRRAGRTTYRYDGQGRLTDRTRRLLNGQKRTWTYTWDTADQLTAVTLPDGGSWGYAYDPLGRRTAKYRLGKDGSAQDRTEFVWDGSRLAEQRTPDGTVTAWDYAPETHRPLTQIIHRPRIRRPGESFLSSLDDDPGEAGREPRLHAVLTDAVGTPTELVTPDGELVWQQRATLWGAGLTEERGAADCPLRFPGQYADEESGLHYNYFRYYDPESGQYTAPDPLGLAGGPNPHRYVPNPHTWTDVFGLDLCRAKPRMEDGNHKEGWQHIDERHITGNHPGGHGDLMPPSTTRDQVQAAADKMIEKGTRVGDPSRTIQTYEKRMVVNGMRARYRLVVDSSDGNRIISFFPVGKSYTP